MTILCGTDFSPPATQASHVAARLAAAMNEPLHLLHVAETPLVLPFSERSEAASPEVLDELNRQADSLRIDGADVLTSMRIGIPDEILLEAAAAINAQIIVLGSLGRRAPVRWLIGSTASNVAQTTLIPLLVVRDPAPLLEWLEGTRRLRIIAGVDSTRTSANALHWASGFAARIGNADLIAAHVVWPPGEQARLGLRGGVSLTDIDPEVETAVRKEISDAISIVQPPPPLRLQIGFGRIAGHLTQLAVDEGADLLVIGTHQRKGFPRLREGSVSQDVIATARGNLACIPRTSEE